MDNKNFKEDDYLGLSKYEGHPASDFLKGFSTFKHDGQFYFALLDSAGKVFMRSEGYSSEKARDNGMTSVNKNKTLTERWTVVEQMKRFFLSLKAGNHQEIAKSGAYKTKADADAALAAFMSGKSAAGTARVAAAVGSAAGGDILKAEDKEDDYLPCKEYEGHTINDKKNNVAMFKHENGQYYFALYNVDGSVKLRSEGFETAKNRDQELSGVLKYHNDDSMYTMLEKGKYFMMVLKDKSGNEVGRSCLNKTGSTSAPSGVAQGASAAGGLATGKIISETRNDLGEKSRKVIGETRNDLGEKSRSAGVEKSRGKAVEKSRSLGIEKSRGKGVEKSRKVIGEKRNVLKETKSKVKEDDYLKCDAYKGHKITDAKNNIATFKGDDGQFYFAVYKKDGSVRLRSEGFASEAGRADELKHCIANMENEKRYSTIKKGKYFINVLKDGTGREVGRSCMSKEVQETVAWVAPVVAAAAAPVVTKKVEKKVAVKKTPPPPPPKKVVPPPPPPKVVPVAAAAPVAEKAAAGGCLKFWPLLLLLLIPLLWFLLKGCGGTPPPPPPPVVVEKTPPPPPPPPAPTCNCDDLTNPVFRIPPGPAPKTLKVLGRAPEYGNSHSLDASGFYNKLNAKYKGSASERRFLDGISKQLGFENGWKDVSASSVSSVRVPRGVSGNMGTKRTHQTVYRKLDPVDAKDLEAFRITGPNTCQLHFMKTCGNHFFYQQCE